MFPVGIAICKLGCWKVRTDANYFKLRSLRWEYFELLSENIFINVVLTPELHCYMFSRWAGIVRSLRVILGPSVGDPAIVSDIATVGSNSRAIPKRGHA